jgi:hypothetical protein
VVSSTSIPDGVRARFTNPGQLQQQTALARTLHSHPPGAVVTTPQDVNDFDDGPGGLLWGYNWRAFLVADAAAATLAFGSITLLGLLTLIGGARPF